MSAPAVSSKAATSTRTPDFLTSMMSETKSESPDANTMMSGFTWYTTLKTSMVISTSKLHLYVPWIDWNVAMSIDEKSPFAHIVEQVVIVQTISFLLGSPVDVRIIHEEDDFFFFHTAL